MAYACCLLCNSHMSRDEPFRIAAAETLASLARPSQAQDRAIGLPQGGMMELTPLSGVVARALRGDAAIIAGKPTGAASRPI
jgi:hypothetical protein